MTFRVPMLVTCAALTALALAPTLSDAQSRGAFPLENTRIASQHSANSAIIVLNGPRRTNGMTRQVRRAAEQWCGGPATATQISGGSGRGDKGSAQFLVRCR